jgi:hypothetical protein
MNGYPSALEGHHETGVNSLHFTERCAGLRPEILATAVIRSELHLKARPRDKLGPALLGHTETPVAAPRIQIERKR